jgi:hypothetical protein
MTDTGVPISRARKPDMLIDLEHLARLVAEMERLHEGWRPLEAELEKDGLKIPYQTLQNWRKRKLPKIKQILDFIDWAEKKLKAEKRKRK